MIFPRQVRSGSDAEYRLRSAGSGAEAGDHLVEHQEDAVLAAAISQAREEPVGWWDDADVARDRLDDDRRNRRGLGRDEGIHRGEIVVTGEQRVGCDRSGNAGAGWNTERHGSRPGLHEKRIRVTVVAALELDDAIAPRESASQPDRAHRCFCS